MSSVSIRKHKVTIVDTTEKTVNIKINKLRRKKNQIEFQVTKTKKGFFD